MLAEGPRTGIRHAAHEEHADPMRIAALRRPTATHGRARGQSLVEFALVLMPLFLLILGVVQFGLIFNSYVTVTNAAREGARTGTIYVYDRGCTKAQNDMRRNEAIRTALLASMNLLSKAAPQFATTAASGTSCAISGGWTASGTTFTNGDMTIAYVLPAGVTESDPRVGQTITVRATYHQDLIIPMIGALLPQDAGGRLALPGEVTMVIN
jgi:Flp pilus assembly protein TadG